ncbi:MAG: hypothetical protein V1794_06080 [Candidatus Glassbacteria bacterium]
MLYNNLTHLEYLNLFKQYGQQESFGRILSLVQNAGCKTIFEEVNPVNEFEYANEYDLFFKTTTVGKSNPQLKRLHFFKSNIQNETQLNNLASRDYLGFCDIRPLWREKTVCKALISNKVFVKSNKDYLYLTCSAKFKVRLNTGKILSVEAFPYIQQDGRVVRCAQAAIATTLQYFKNSSFGGPWKLTEENTISGSAITTAAMKLASAHRDLPSRGLTGESIGIILKNFGLHPLMYQYPAATEELRESNKPAQLIYRYIESGIPVIVGIRTGSENHALVIIGHTFSPDTWMSLPFRGYYRQGKTGKYYNSSTEWIEQFVVQDDNYGPYMLARKELFETKLCELLIVPLPGFVYLRAEEAEKFVGTMITGSRGTFISELYKRIDRSQLHQETEVWIKELLENAKREEIVLRTYLIKSLDWKNKQKNSTTDAEYHSIIDNMNLPNHVWVVEVSWPSIFRHSRYQCGEIIVDSSEGAYTPQLPVLWQLYLCIRLPGLIIVRDPAIDPMVAPHQHVKINIMTGPDRIYPHRKSY